MKQAANILERLYANSMPEPNSGCWLWLGGLNGGGYAQMAIRENGGSRSPMAHRLMYEAIKGPIPEGLQLDHLCRVRCCINPDHLEPVTARENTLRGISLQAQNAKKTHCPNGHEYQQRPGETRRRCRICDKMSCRKSRVTHIRRKTPPTLEHGERGMRRDMWNRCVNCGRLISYEDFTNGRAVNEFVSPQSEFTDERFEAYHVNCKALSNGPASEQGDAG